MDNYAVMLTAAKQRFCSHNMENIARKTGVTDTKTHLCTTFLGEWTEVEKATGNVMIAGREASFCEGLTVFDWLCDRKDTARVSGEFAPVSSLPGVVVSGSGLALNGDRLAAKVDKTPEKLVSACEALGGSKTGAGDIGYQIMAFPDLPLQLKFYHSDEEFSASMTLLWDKNTLDFIRYETVYYLAACLLKRLEGLLGP